MRWKLAANVHWCNCNGRAVFLDVGTDRYFCLPQAMNQAFLRLAAGNSHISAEAELESLARRGLLVEDQRGEGVKLSAQLDPPQRDFACAVDVRARLQHIARAVIAELGFAWRLRRWSFADVLRRCTRVTRSPALGRGDERRSVARLVAAAEVAAILLRSHDRCLVRGLAVHSLCRRRGIASKLVLGVVAHPFSAHCWVQLGSEVLVGGYEQARLYTPILVLE